jgi:hypothetical protein
MCLASLNYFSLWPNWAYFVLENTMRSLLHGEHTVCKMSLVVIRIPCSVVNYSLLAVLALYANDLLHVG